MTTVPDPDRHPTMPIPSSVRRYALLLALLLVSASPLHAQQSTAAPGTGAPGVIECTKKQTGDPSINCAGAGNPINLITGNKYQREVDMAALPGVFGLEIVRHYNSAYSIPGAPNGLVGRGWKLSYETALFAIGNSIQIVMADGTRLMFGRDPLNRALCQPADPANGTVTIRRTPRDGDEYLWHRTDGTAYMFDSSGNLIQIVAPGGEFVSLLYDGDGQLMQVTDPQNRQLRLHRPDRKTRSKTQFSGVENIDSPVGRFRYHYGSTLPAGATVAPIMLAANLVGVDFPGGDDKVRDKAAKPDASRNPSTAPDGPIARQYHYEDPQHPTRLTGISVVGKTNGQVVTQRLSTFGYQADGRAILTTHANDVDRVTLAYPAAGTTVLTNSLGQTTVYQHASIAGENRILESRGPGCRLCSPTNVRFSYDALAREITATQLDDQGMPVRTTQTQRDYYGRPLAISERTYRNGAAGPARAQVRYEYAPGALPAPVRVARPSMVPGREAITDIAYNDVGQPLSVTETGWAPAIDSVTPQPITRKTNYRYDRINRRSLLVQVDGPLANGPAGTPADSDITLFHYDMRGSFLTDTVAPGNRLTRVTRDEETGRPTVIESGDGSNPAQRTVITSNLQGQPVRIVRERADSPARQADQSSWRPWFARNKDEDSTKSTRLITHITYDAQGHPQRLTRPDGSWLAVRADQAGRPIGLTDQDGHRIDRTLDSESRLLTTLLHSSAINAPLDASTSYQYDVRNRLTQQTDPAGAVTQYAYAEATGQLATSTDALQRTTAFAYDPIGRMTAVTQNAGTDLAAITRATYLQDTSALSSLIAANGATTSNLTDDFGRTLVIDSPDSGRQIAQYDAADRLIARVDANGNRTDLTWDMAGQMITRRVSGHDSSGQPTEQRITYRYQGNRLIAVTDPQQITTLHYDANGHVVERTDHLTRAIERDKPALAFTTRYRYDALNRLEATTLASGETVRITYGPASRPQRIDLVSADGKFTRALATDIELHPFTGLAGFTHGNGVRTRYERNPITGRLVALKVGVPAQGNPVTQALLTLLPDAQAANDKAAASAKDRATGQQLRNLLYAQRLDYDVIGRITAIARTRIGQAAPESEQYDYDHQDRLSKVNTPTEQVAWRHDAVGNRLSENTDQALTYQPASNRLVGIRDADKRTAYTYDPAGNPTTIGDKSYVYDVIGRLQQVSDGKKIVARYAYNAHGERVSKTVTNAEGIAHTTYFLYQGNRLDAEADEAGRITAQYLYVDQMPVAKLAYGNTPAETGLLATLRRWLGLHDKSTDSQVYAIHTDHLGTPQLVTDAQQHPVWQASYSAFGKAKVSTEKIMLNLRLPGQHFDVETDKHYNLHRDYDPLVGRYLTSDPIGLKGGFNTYSYVGGNPLSFVDPLGLRDVIVAVWTSQIPSGSVGHVFVGEMNGTTITSQFPTPHGIEGANTTKSWLDTVAAEGRLPDSVYQVTVLDDNAFDAAAAVARGLPRWSAFPNGTTSTNCTNASNSALKAGGVIGISSASSAWPNWMNTDLTIASWFGKQVTKLPAAPW
ncbi:RHS repeat-associated core domain-containing protein [Actimicrobium sp. CCC2.4]|uniref:RHS repeat-associated core domain-containing protein n=1 Tax=Actimicrobium sp. CCC2.4 TaxID=3048606 RepID=UPI002AC8F1D2|nr:RHS repeat-associated core domain-containing protein [Actimicrobium sp. CCC2.4]MEB0134768.1 RHS repeat-associated core domain-containing protein [Actimicrobium sp. CCC2.4]WPX30707.1 RHS repeat-associated core domain-containing protein [Actimicrobium sp. CCC2.4]